MFDIDLHGDRPGWKQLADQLRDRMRGGELRPGDRLPSENRIREATGLSRTTVRAAILRLQQEGLVEVRAPRGAFVREQGGRTELGPGDSLVLLSAAAMVRADGAYELVPAGKVVAAPDAGNPG
jgi:DNA-binding GntR family transcriptional regulator